MVNWNQFKKMLDISYPIAIIIFFTATTSEFSVRMYFSSENPVVQIMFGLLAIIFLTFLFALLISINPTLKRAIIHIFGMD